jgi:hypothetical protein
MCTLDKFLSFSLLFTSSFAFGANVVDPLVTSMHFISVVLEHHIFAHESTVKVAERATRGFIKYSSVYFSHQTRHFCLRDAAIRFRPNGEEIRCHNHLPKFVCKTRVRNNNAVIFRCSRPEHDASGPHGRKFAVELLEDEPPLRKFIGDQPRLMMTAI